MEKQHLDLKLISLLSLHPCPYSHKNKINSQHAVYSTPIYYHDNMRNLENTKIHLFICLKILRNKKIYKKKTKTNKVILCITNFEIATDHT